MKSMNCISTIGRMPMCAAPAAAPTIPISEIGESMTRCSPNLASRPSVTLNAPPYAPMSSPTQKTFGSRSISSKCASRMASRYVISGIARRARRIGPPSFRALGRAHHCATRAEPERLVPRRISVDALERIERFGRWRLLRFVGRPVDLRTDPRGDRLELGPVEVELLHQPRHVPIDRVGLLLPSLHLA